MAAAATYAVRDLVIYQVFTRNYPGGTFRALREDLPRIRSLGADAVYLLPVQQSGVLRRKGSVGSPYAIRDYRAVDPSQGTWEDLSDLHRAAGKLGMKLILDVVYNHTSPDSVLAEAHPDWFYHRPDGSFGNRIGDWWDVIDLDYAHRDLWDYQIGTLRMWARVCDGFRCDVAPLVPLAFWEEARAAVEEVRPGALWIGESVDPGFIAHCRARGIPIASDGEMYRAFDVCYDYDIYDLQKAAMADASALGPYLEAVGRQEVSFPENYSKLRCLENHDRERAAALIERRAALRSWTAWIFFVKGTTMLYAGEEFSRRHLPTLFEKDPVLLRPEEGGEDLSALMARLSRIKKEIIPARSFFTAQAAGEKEDVILARHIPCGPEEERKTVVFGLFPLGEGSRTVAVSCPDGTYREEISGGTVTVKGGQVSLGEEPVIFSAE